MVSDEAADGVIIAVSTLVGSAAAWFVVGDADTEHASFAKERVVARVLSSSTTLTLTTVAVVETDLAWADHQP